MNKYFIAGGFAAAVFAAKLAYEKFFNKEEIVPKEIVIKKLIDMKEYLYPILFEIASIVANKLTPQQVPPDQAKLFIMESDELAFKENIAKILSEKVYFDITEEKLQYAIENTYENDKEVQFYKKSFQEEFEKCFLGIQPEALSTRMLVLNQNTVLEIVSKILESTSFLTKQDKIKKLRTLVESYKNELQKGEISKEKAIQNFEAFLIKDENNDDEFRHQILKEYRIEDVKTFEFAVAKFLKESETFKNKYQQIQSDFQRIVVEELESCQ